MGKTTRKNLVSGAGIASLTQAFWLVKFGFDVTVIVGSPKLRDEGYMMDFSVEGIQFAKASGSSLLKQCSYSKCWKVDTPTIGNEYQITAPVTVKPVKVICPVPIENLKPVSNIYFRPSPNKL